MPWTEFRTEFAHAMDKLSSIGVLTGFQGEVASISNQEEIQDFIKNC